ncbi:hypothetical protein [Psychroserpens sp. S379A]|uniref:hypothetical protein n=1 Tax=Psychroserpens sp. S379A TaxID=3415137 RepID=UPI003C7AFB78
MILVSRYLVPKGYVGIVIFPFILLKYKHLSINNVLLNHEKIHLRQQLELFLIIFYIWYGVEFLIRLLIYKKWHKAYKNISFEKEAYANENDLNYLKSRSFYNFLNYM